MILLALVSAVAANLLVPAATSGPTNSETQEYVVLYFPRGLDRPLALRPSP
jgi:hypothetical protein